MKIIINNTEVTIKNKMRAYMIYEALTEKAFNPKTFTEMMLYFYSLVLANSNDLNLTFNDFIEYLDEHTDVATEFNQWLTNENRVNQQFQDVKKNKEKK